MIILSGAGFTSQDQVFIGEKPCSSVSANPRGTSIACVVPASTVAGTQPVTVLGVESQKIVMQKGFTYLLPPSVDQVVPNVVRFRPRMMRLNPAELTINGKGFIQGAAIKIGSKICPVTKITSSSITCRLPMNNRGIHSVTVTNPDGQTATKTDGVTYLEMR
jgi:hypothetical protein